MKFEKKINIEIKLLSLAVGVLAVFCSIHQLGMLNP